jgi:hypothetical protein
MLVIILVGYLMIVLDIPIVITALAEKTRVSASRILVADVVRRGTHYA